MADFAHRVEAAASGALGLGDGKHDTDGEKQQTPDEGRSSDGSSDGAVFSEDDGVAVEAAGMAGAHHDEDDADADADEEDLEDLEGLETASNVTNVTGVMTVKKMLDQAKNAREGAMQAANQMWSRTKIVRSKFPSKPQVGRMRKASFAPGRRGSARLKHDAVMAALKGAKSRHHGTEDFEEPELIYDSMKEMWEDDVFNLPVCKDLPRLVRRICVLDKDDEILYLAPGASAPEGTRLEVPQAAGAPTPPPSAAAAAKDDDDDEDTDTAGSGAAKRNSKLVRWSLRRKKDGRKSIREQDLSTNAAVVALIVDFISVLAAYLESSEGRRGEIDAGLTEIQASVTEASDLQLVVRQMIEVVGTESKITKVLKTIHQNVVLQSTVELKQKLTMKYQTKDVRTADGWRIIITLAKGFAQVRHTRREQSLDAFGDSTQHWELEWELRMTFDERLEKMTAAQLRITRLILSDTMDEELAEELKSTLVDGLIVM